MGTEIDRKTSSNPKLIFALTWRFYAFLFERFAANCVLTGGVFGGCPGGKSGDGAGGGGALLFGFLGFFE